MWGAWAGAVVAALGLMLDTPVAPAAKSGALLPKQTVVFYNARLALRDDQPQEALKLWLLRNALTDQGEPSRTDADFRSVVWASLGRLGLCPDGFPKDDRGGAGLWPLAAHNWLVHAATMGPPLGVQGPFDAFEIGRQQRFVSLSDVLSTPELRSVTFHRGMCLLPALTLLGLRESPSMDPADRLATGRLMRWFLARALTTLVRDKFQNLAAVEARIFDLDLVLAQTQTRRARQAAGAAKQRAQTLGVSETAAAEMAMSVDAWAPGSEQAKFLRRTLGWRASAWLSLNRTRRLFLFAQARPFSQDPASLQSLVLEIIDALMARGEGDEVALWIGHLEATGAPDRRRALCSGDRGRRLLALDRAHGFRERATVALHRGVEFLETGQREDALSSFAYALAQAEESREAVITAALARRWLAFVLSRYDVDESLIATLKALVPRQEYNGVVESLLWSAAFRADERSFARIAVTVRSGTAFDAQIARLRLLASGKGTDLAAELRRSGAEEPSSTMRFAKSLIEKLESEDAGVRAANLGLLKSLMAVIKSFAEKPGGSTTHVRTAETLMARVQAIADGVGHVDASVTGQARSLAPGHETFAGHVRLAPVDPLPWPFAVPEAEAPSAFVPLAIEPVEWRNARNDLVFGWRITE